MSFLVVLPPVLGQLWCLSWWFCLLSWDNSDRCGIFWLGWLMDVGRMRELRHLCGHSQPDFSEWVGVAPSMSQKGSLMLRKKWGETSAVPVFHLGSAPENGTHQVSSFLWETQEKALFRGTWWGPFSGAKQSGKLPERRRWQKIGDF